MGNTHKESRIIIPAKNRHVKLGVGSYLPSCSSSSSLIDQLSNQNPESQSNIFSEFQSQSSLKLVSSDVCNPSICGDSSQNSDLKRDRKLSVKNERILRIVKKIIGEEHVDFYTQEMLVYLINYPEQPVHNILHPNLQDFRHQKLLKRVKQQKFLHKLVDKTVFHKQKMKFQDK